MSKFVFGWDLDNVLITNHTSWHQVYEKNYIAHKHKEHTINQAAHTWDYWKPFCRVCWHECLHDPNVILNYDIDMVGVSVLQTLHGMGVEQHIITSRPDDVSKFTREWVLAKKLGNMISEVWVTQDKVYTAQKIGAHLVVDDAPNKIKLYKEANIPVIIWDQPYNQHLKGDRANNWYTLLKQVSAGVRKHDRLEYAQEGR